MYIHIRTHRYILYRVFFLPLYEGLGFIKYTYILSTYFTRLSIETKMEMEIIYNF